MNPSFDTDITHVLKYHDPASAITAAEIYENVGTFAQAEIRPADDVLDLKTGEFPHDMWKKLGNQGFKGIIVPDEFGGLGAGYLALCAATLQISRASGSIGLSYIADQALCTHQIVKHGTPVQKARYLPALASGDAVGALAMSEPDAGSDVMAMRTSAVRAADGRKGFILNGSKMWITNGGRIENGKPVTADVQVVYAKTSDKPVRLTAFILEKGMPGFSAASKISKEGLRGSETFELSFDNVFVPDENILGAEGRGANVLMAGLNAERLVLAAGALGLAMAAHEEAADYTVQRKTFGLPVAFNQSVAFDFADMYSKIVTACASMFTLAAMADKGQDISNAMAASVFLEGSQIATRVSEQNVYYHGGNGQTVDYRAGRLRRDASLYRVGGGSEGVRLLRIAEQIIPGYADHVKLERKMRNQLKGTTP